MSRKTFHFQQPHGLRLTGAARRLRSSLVPPPSPRFASPSATVVTTITRVRLLPSSYQIHRRGWEPRIQLLLVKSLQLTPPIYSSCSGPVFADNGALGSVIEMLFHLRAGKLSRCLISVSVYRWFCGVISRILSLHDRGLLILPGEVDVAQSGGLCSGEAWEREKRRAINWHTAKSSIWCRRSGEACYVALLSTEARLGCTCSCCLDCVEKMLVRKLMMFEGSLPFALAMCYDAESVTMFFWPSEVRL